MSKIKCEQIYGKSSGGTRILVDRLWPRGISRERAQLDLWAKDAAPSTELRKWYDHDPEKFDEFCRRYEKELDDNDDAASLFGFVRRKLADGDVTLLYAAADHEHNNAVALKNWIIKNL